jgi:dTDP-4-dehydrorhamnose reductase
MKKVLITGGNGLLGQKVVKLFTENKYQVFAVSRGQNRIESFSNFNYQSLNLTNLTEVKQYINKIKPNYIVNCAAMTNVDQCEIEKETCNILNTSLVKTLTEYCEKENAFLVQLSTDFIFDGEKGNYAENDTPNPLNYYGKSKLNAENILINSSIKFAILRTILVYGKVENPNRNNIVLWIKNALENKQSINLITDQYRTPTYNIDLANACFEAIHQTKTGIFHISSTQLLSIYEIGLQIAKVFNLDTSLIKKISTKKLNQKAKRPIKTGFNLTKSTMELNLKFYSFKENLEQLKSSLK